MFHRFFVPLDGSLRAELAIPVAAKLARASAGTVILARIIVPSFPEEYRANIVANEALLVQEQEQAAARVYLDEVMERYDQVLQGLHLIVEVSPDTSTVASTLLSLAGQEHTDMIVMCSRGERWFKRWAFGSVAQQTMHHSPFPVLALHEHRMGSVLEHSDHGLRVLVPLDGSTFSEALMQPLCEFLALFPGMIPLELHLLQVVMLPTGFGRFRSGAYVTDLLIQDEQHKAEQYLEGIAQHIVAMMGEKTPVVVTTEVVVQTDVAGTVLKRAHAMQEAGSGYDMIALATHGRSGLKRAALGSVTDHVFDATTLPLFVVCPTTAEGEKQGRYETSETQPSQGLIGLL